jgi:hypothetical protein
MIIRIRTQNEMVGDLQMGIRLVDQPEIEGGLSVCETAARRKSSAGGKVFEGEGGTAANEDLDADRDPFNIHTLFQQAGRQGA